jgi:hypothetical protein
VGTQSSHSLNFFAGGSGAFMTLSTAGNLGVGSTTPITGIDMGLNRIIGTSATDASGQHGIANRGIKASFGSVMSTLPSEFVGMRTLIGPGTNGCGNTADIRFDAWECATSSSREVMRITGRGNVSVPGMLSKGGGTFKIDHPLDPENKYLFHSFVESPDMKNIYDGVVTTDNQGYATVALPAYFEALNTGFRYQVTVLDDGEHLSDFVLVRVVKKIADTRLATRSSMPRSPNTVWHWRSNQSASAGVSVLGSSSNSSGVGAVLSMIGVSKTSSWMSRHEASYHITRRWLGASAKITWSGSLMVASLITRQCSAL